MKGYQKRVIYLKNTGSHIFDEAVFFVKGENDLKELGKGDMVNEANRIIEESLGKLDTQGRGSGRFLGFFAPFLLGVSVCILAVSVFSVILM